MNATTKKITRATFKSFVAKNRENLLILCESSFDAMVDGTTFNENPEFKPVTESIHPDETHNFGLAGVWLVGGSRNSFTAYNKNGIEGIQVYNCCGCFTVGIKK